MREFAIRRALKNYIHRYIRHTLPFFHLSLSLSLSLRWSVASSMLWIATGMVASQPVSCVVATFSRSWLCWRMSQTSTRSPISSPMNTFMSSIASSGSSIQTTIWLLTLRTSQDTKAMVSGKKEKYLNYVAQWFTFSVSLALTSRVINRLLSGVVTRYVCRLCVANFQFSLLRVLCDFLA